jgi:hypothetical protein
VGFIVTRRVAPVDVEVVLESVEEAVLVSDVVEAVDIVDKLDEEPWSSGGRVWNASENPLNVVLPGLARRVIVGLLPSYWATASLCYIVILCK